MEKFDSVDRLMRQAAEPAAGGKSEGKAAFPVPSGGLAGPQEPATGAPPALEPSAAAGTPGRLGRQLLGNLDSVVPVLSRALQSIPHGGVQAVGRGVQAAERFVPLLRLFAGSPAAAGVAAPAASVPAIPAASTEKQSALEAEITSLRERVDTQEEQLRRMREGLERTVAEQGTLAHATNQMQDRSRLLTAGLLILLLLVITQVILLAVALRR